MPILEYNEEASEKLLAVYTTPDVEAQRQEFINNIDLLPGKKVLDVGSGPGFLARIIKDKVGAKGLVHGIDVSEFMINIAQSKSDEKDGIKFSYGDATDLQFPDESFDTITCTQVLEYLNDVDKALKEFNRIVRKGGKVAILDTDWDSIVWHSSNPERMRRVLKIWEAHASDPFLPRTLSPRMERAGFKVIAQKIFTLYNPCYKEKTYSNRMIDLITPFVIENGNLSEEEAKLWAKELRNGSDYDYFFSLNRYFFLGRKI
jgi:ubiquinone/menaquinone biosynthesis C-methylase UbiE